MRKIYLSVGALIFALALSSCVGDAAAPTCCRICGPDAGRADMRRFDTLRPDTLKFDTRRVDLLRPDSKKPDLQVPDSLRADVTIPIPSGPLNTWVPMSWTAFPVDRGPNYVVTGNTWIVKTTGNDNNPGTPILPLKTIAMGLMKAQPGDKVQVHAGTYAELTPGDFQALVMDKDNVVLTAAPGETVTVTPISSSFRYGIGMSGSNLVVNGINLQGFAPSIALGNNTQTQKNIVISNLTATAQVNGFDGIVNYQDNTQKTYPSSDGLLLKNVTVKGAGLSVSCNSGPCNSWKLENVVVVGTGGSGSGADAIAIESGDNILFLNIDVSGASADGIDSKATRTVVWGCNVHNIERNGVKLWHGGDIVNTLIHHTGADASVVIRGSRVRILHSIIAYHNFGSSESYNIAMNYDDNAPIQVDIINSIVWNASGGAYFSTAATLNLQNNIFFGIENGRVLDIRDIRVMLSDGVAKITTNGLGSGNLFLDPMLNLTFHPMSGSPAINNGLLLPNQYPVLDLAGLPRVKNGVPDIGVFEDF